MYFLQFCADLSKKSKSTQVIYIDASKKPSYTLSENVIVSYGMTYCFRDIRVWVWKKISQHLSWYFDH